MNEHRRLSHAVIFALILVLVLPTAGLARKKKDHVATDTMDDGRLTPTWFAAEGLAFREADEIDYLWVKPGFTIDGRTFHFVDWPEPELRGDDGEGRDEDDNRLARQMNSEMARSFSDILGRTWDGTAQTSLESGDVTVEGRIVDCSTGSRAAKMWVGMGAGAGGTTIDLKFTDTQSGELVAAIHHRVTSGTTWSTTDSKFFNWIEELGEDVRKQGLSTLYEKGDPQKE